MVPSGIAAYAVLVTSKSNKDNADNLKTLPNELLLSELVSLEDLTAPLANSEVTTNDCVVLFQITLKILFMRFLIFQKSQIIHYV